jgi:hypothetical protein
MAEPIDGVVVGLVVADTTTLPEEASPGFEFAGANVWAVEGSVRRAVLDPLVGTERFHVVRFRQRVFLCRGDEPSAVADVPFELPGQVVYAATSQVSTGTPMHLDAVLRGTGDRVITASITHLNALGNGEWAPLDGYGGDLVARGIGSMAPLTGRAGPRSAGDGQLSVLVGRALQVGQNMASGALSPLTATATGARNVSAGTGWLQPLSGRGTDVAGNFGSGQLAPLYSIAQGRQIAFAPPMSVELPALSGAAEVPDLLMVADGFVIGGEAELSGDTFMVSDAFRVRDAAMGQTINATRMVQDGFRVLERVRIGVGRTFDSTLRVGERVMVGSARMVADGFTVTDGTERSTITPPTSRTVEEGLRLRGAVSQVSNVTVESGLRVLDAASIHVTVLAEDGFTVADAVAISSAEPLRLVEERLAIGDATEVQIITVAMVEEGFRVRDRALVAGQGLIAWVMNTETAGVSWYENWAFQDMAQVGDTVVAVGPDGLVVLGEDFDEGIDIEAGLDLGYTDFSGYDRAGLPKNDQWNKQHLVALWFGYRADGILDAVVQTQGNAAYTYKLQRQPAREPRNSRLKPGKGLNERFYRIRLGNVAGCAFEVNSIAAEVVPSKQRRI